MEFSEILEKKRKIIKNKNVLSPHYIPKNLPFRENEIKKIMFIISPALINEKPKNIFIYGKSGTGKTCCTKYILKKFNEEAKKRNVNAKMIYINCKMNYDTRYKIIRRILKDFDPKLKKTGFGFLLYYERLLELMKNGLQIVLVLDEIDEVKKLDELVYTFTRINDECENGSVTIIGISNRIQFKKLLEGRSKSSLYEEEIIFPPYTAIQLKQILKERGELGLMENVVDESALNLAAAITARENGDARFALKLFEKAAEIAENEGLEKITDIEVERARKEVELDLVKEIICRLPEHSKLALLSIANLSIHGSKYAKLVENEETKNILTSGEVYEGYLSLCGKYSRRPRTSRWFRDCLTELEALGLITLTLSGKGMRGHTTLIRLSYEPKDLIKLIKIENINEN